MSAAGRPRCTPARSAGARCGKKATLTRQHAGRLQAAGQEAQAARVAEQAQLNDRHGQLIRSVLLEATPNPETQPLVQQAPEEAWREGQPPASADEE